MGPFPRSSSSAAGPPPFPAEPEPLEPEPVPDCPGKQALIGLTSLDIQIMGLRDNAAHRAKNEQNDRMVEAWVCTSAQPPVHRCVDGCECQGLAVNVGDIVRLLYPAGDFVFVECCQGRSMGKRGWIPRDALHVREDIDYEFLVTWIRERHPILGMLFGEMPSGYVCVAGIQDRGAIKEHNARMRNFSLRDRVFAGDKVLMIMETWFDECRPDVIYRNKDDLIMGMRRLNGGCSTADLVTIVFSHMNLGGLRRNAARTGLELATRDEERWVLRHWERWVENSADVLRGRLGAISRAIQLGSL